MEAITCINHEALDLDSCEVATLARQFCELIDASNTDSDQWLFEISRVLSRLHAVMTSLPHPRRKTEWVLVPVDLDARFELFSRLRRLLADRDGYWLEFDLVDGRDGVMTGSLADDLTDIYHELRHGLGIFSQDPDRGLATWWIGYDGHWRQHLVDAERHLASLMAEGRLQVA